jgi:malonyl-CoA O-methyltransferase
VSEETPYRLDRSAVRSTFDRASKSYDAAAVLQRQVRETLLERLELVSIEPKVVLDAGAGTGWGSRALRKRYPGATVLAADSSAGMLRVAGRRRGWRRPFVRVCADASAWPLAQASVDLVFSNFLLPWVDLPEALAEFRRVLAPRGLLTFTTLGPDTLKELKAAWAELHAHDRVARFIDMHHVGDALVQAGFAAPVLDVEYYTLEYSDLAALAADLKAAGSGNPSEGRPRGLTTPRRLAALGAVYERFRSGGRLPATYEVVFGQAWAPAERAARGSEVGIALDDIRRKLAERRRSGVSDP